jgi:hypothetical protein
VRECVGDLGVNGVEEASRVEHDDEASDLGVAIQAEVQRSVGRSSRTSPGEGVLERPLGQWGVHLIWMDTLHPQGPAGRPGGEGPRRITTASHRRRREVLVLDVDGAGWLAFLRSLRARQSAGG